MKKINFQLNAGDILQIQGTNGCGKTTLLRILAGFIEPTFGKLYWKDECIFSQRSWYQEQLLYLGHQNGLKTSLTVIENIKLMSAMQQTSCQMEMIQQVLSQIGLMHLGHKQVKYLSAGQKRRLSYARLLLLSKGLWILDEPTTSVDSEGQRIFVSLLKKHVQKGGIAIIATHLPIEVEGSTTLAMGEGHG